MTTPTDRAGAIIGAALAVLAFGSLILALALRLCLRRSPRWTYTGTPLPTGVTGVPQFDTETAPALARLQRALAKGGGTTAAELDAVAPVEPFQPVQCNDDSENVCAICLEGMTTGVKSRRLPCGHAFDAVCVEQWAAKANRCPICNASPVDPDEMALRRANRAANMLSEFTAPRTRRRRERDNDGVFRLNAITIADADVIVLPPPLSSSPPTLPQTTIADTRPAGEEQATQCETP